MNYQLFILFHVPCLSAGMEAPWGQKPLSVWLLMYFKCLEQDLATGALKRFPGWKCHRLLLRLHILTNLISPIPTGRHYCYYYYYHYYFFLKDEETEAQRVKPPGQDHTSGKWSRKHSGPRSPDFQWGSVVTRPSPTRFLDSTTMQTRLQVPVPFGTTCPGVSQDYKSNAYNNVSMKLNKANDWPKAKVLVNRTTTKTQEVWLPVWWSFWCIQNWFLRSERLFGQYSLSHSYTTITKNN